MANWASTNYAIEGSKETLKKIYDAIQHPDTSEGDSGWEGGVLKALGIKWKERQSDGSGYYMRGFIQDPECIEFNPETNDTLSFYAEEAWGLTDFNEALAENFPDIKIYWVVEESGEEIYATNDKEGKYFPERFYVDACIDGEYKTEYFEKEESMYKYIADITKNRVKTPKEVEVFNADYEDSEEVDENFIYIHKFEVMD